MLFFGYNKLVEWRDIMEELKYMENDRYFPNHEPQRIYAEKVMDIAMPDVRPGMNVLEGLAFDKNKHMYICVPAQSRIVKVDPFEKNVLDAIELPYGMKPSAIKIHRDGRLFVTAVASEKGSMVVIISEKGELLETVEMKGKHIDDMVFDSKGGFYCSDLSGTINNPCAGIFYVSSDLKTVTDIISTGLIKSNGIALTPDEKGLWFTEFGASRLHKIQFGYDGFAENDFKSFIPYYFEGLEGPDSMVVDEDGNLYIAMTGQGKYMVFNPNAVPIGEILIPEREEGKMLKSTHITICPDTNIAFMCTADMNSSDAAIYQARVFSKAHKGFQFSK